MSVAAVPPPLPPRKVPRGLGDTDHTGEHELNEKHLRELYDNEGMDLFPALFSDVCDTLWN